MFCSVPLGVPFISMARQWIRTVYSMLRSTEVTVLLRHRETYVRAAQIVRFFTHDSHKFMQESVGTVLRQINDCSAKATAYRSHIIQVMRMLNTFTYTVSSAFPDPDKLARQREAFLKALNVDKEGLVGYIYKAAWDVREYRTGTRQRSGATVDIPEPPSLGEDGYLGETYVYCLLLVGEMVRNYCKHGPRGQRARLTAAVNDGQLSSCWKARPRPTHWARTSPSSTTSLRPSRSARRRSTGMMTRTTLASDRPAFTTGGCQMTPRVLRYLRLNDEPPTETDDLTVELPVEVIDLGMWFEFCQRLSQRQVWEYELLTIDFNFKEDMSGPWFPPPGHEPYNPDFREDPNLSQLRWPDSLVENGIGPNSGLLIGIHLVSHATTATCPAASPSTPTTPTSCSTTSPPP